MGAAMVRRGVETHKLFKAFAGVLSAQSVSCLQPSQKRGGKQSGSDNMFSLRETSELFSSKQSLAAFVGTTAPIRSAPTAGANAFFAGVSPTVHANPVLSEPALEPHRSCVAAFQK